MDMKLELINVPVTDIDRAKDFYVKIGFSADHDQRVNENLRFVQLTPPGSACSICIGQGLTTMKPGSLESLLVVVEDINKARQHLLDAGVKVGEVDIQPWGSFVYFTNPDGNKWSVQQLPDYSKDSETVKAS
jgi:predicted enzyme related to lactoylglutathione lyase